MNKDCNLKVTVKGAMTDEDGKVRMINRELTGEGVMLFVNDDVDGEHTRLHALTVGGFGITVQAKIIGALRKAWGEGRFEAALALDMIGSEKGEETDRDTASGDGAAEISEEEIGALVEDEIEKALKAACFAEAETQDGSESE